LSSYQIPSSAISIPSNFIFFKSLCGGESLHANLVPRVFLVVARELRKTLVKYDEISKILGDLSHAQ
jgi:hypothetical protein